MKRRFAGIALAIVSFVFADRADAQSNSVTVTVPGTADPWLAGMPAGSTASCAHGICDYAPAQSPREVTELPITPGASLAITATGGVAQDPSFPLAGPNGTSAIASHDAGANNGMSNITAPMSSLIGVFLESSPPNLFEAPGPAADPSHPSVRQIFLVGSNATIIVPDGAARLFLGTMDSFQWSNNPGFFTVTIISSSLAAPTNLRANQIGLSGTQIQLTWDYGTDPIDGFRIERKTPLGTTWEVVPMTLLAGQRSWIDSTINAFATYTYRIIAFGGSNESAPSNEATCFQLKLSTSSNGTAIEAIFQPGESLSALAEKFGFGHFNWISIATFVPPTIEAPPRPFLDPPLDYDPFNERPTDSFPYYWDDVFGFDVAYFIGSWTRGNTVQFSDRPGYPRFNPLLPTLDHMEFKTLLVGVQGPIGSSSWQFKPLASFSWNSNHIGDWGGVYDYRFSNLDPPLTSGPGGVFNVELVDTEDLPLDIREFLVKMGAQGVRTAPKIDKDPPMTAAFLSGTQGTNGWYTGPVTVSLIATDIDGPADIASTAFSLNGGSANFYTGPFVVSGDGNQAVEFGSVDQVGNAEAPLRFQTFKVDATPPDTAITSPTDGGVYVLNTALVSTYACTDTTSGLASCSGSVPSGAPLSTAAVGSFDLTVNAADNAGNSVAAKSTYLVQYGPAGTLCLGQAGHTILQPINGDGSSVFRQGSTVPVKFRVCDGQGVAIGTPGVVSNFSLVQVLSTTSSQNVNEAPDSATPDNAFRWDPTNQQWIFNLETRALSAGQTYIYRISLNDGTKIQFQFGLR